MQRLFPQHHIRKTIRLSPLWTLTTLDAGGLSHPVQVVVPHCWESVPGLRRYKGRAAYENRFMGGGTLRFVFGGVSFRAKAYLDGELIAEHYGAFTAFSAMVERVPVGEHTLRIEADNRYGEDSTLHVENDYYSYGGVNRPVEVQCVNDAIITGLSVRTHRENGAWIADVQAAVTILRDDAQEISLSLRAASQEKRVRWQRPGGRESTVLRVRIPVEDAALWSPENPALYDLDAVLYMDGRPVDDLCDRFGFREIAVQGSQILLNGHKLTIKGFNRHETYADFGSAVPLEAMARDVQMMKDLGANAVRTCHYPNDPRFLDLCDEMGLLVWEESHARALSLERMQTPLFKQQTELCVREMIAQHGNHPSIFIWGCLNECEDTKEEGAVLFRWNMDLIRSLDESRPVTAALLDRKGSLVFGDCDVVSLNLYPLWYHETDPADHVENMTRYVAENGGADKPIIVSEIGAGAIYGRHDLGAVKWSEERQSEILVRQIQAVLGNAHCCGIFLWQFADCRVDESWMEKRPGCMNNKGVVDEFRRPKHAYRMVKACFAKF